MKINDFDNEEKLRSLIKDSINNSIDDLDFYKGIKYTDFDYSKMDIHRKGRSLKVLTVVASIAIILVLSSVLAILISNGSVSASIFEFEQSFVKLGNGITSDENKYVKDDSIVEEINNLDDLNDGIDFFPGLFISNEIPERFMFKSLTITKYAGDVYYAVYLYRDSDDQILTISQQTIPKEGISLSLVGITDEIKTDVGTIYISENPFGDGGNSATYEKKDYYIDVAGKIEKVEILRIFNQD
ncbi:MAG TPA: DUF4367 domain-containing protein [Anaerovoracaceae bacterium]|nr:DUF4367 domain-containing protein [Anaerovoracaceae bacterium]